MLNIRKLLPAAWIISFIALLALTRALQSESSQFFGIADNSEQAISFSYAVEIVQNLVIDGAEVKQGQPILEVRRPDLSARLTIVEDQIHAATALHNKTVETTRARLEELTAKSSAEVAELDAQIETLRDRQAINGKLLKDISGAAAVKPLVNPIATEIRGLAAQKKYLQESFNARIANLQSQLETENDQFKVQIAESQDRKRDLERQLSDLTVRAKFDGRIGSVNFEPGDKIAPFETILTVHSSSPLFVKGFIHENVYNQLKIGQRVWVRRYGAPDDEEVVAGEVESLGSRIVEYPMRLKKNQLVSAWGREAIIRLPQDTSLLLGEKVVVAMQSPDAGRGLGGSLKKLISGTVSTAEAAPNKMDNGPVLHALPIVSKVSELPGTSVEASGIVLGSNPGEFYVISDETGELQPRLLVMNYRGELTQLREIAGGVEIDDMESISRDGEAVYVSASLSYSNKGKRKQKRCQLLRLESDGDMFRVRGRLNLCEVLAQLAESSEDRGARRFLDRAIARQEIDVESHVVHEGNLYIGFKTPFDYLGNTVILRIDDLAGLFAGEPAQGRIWQRLALLDPQNGAPALLSDMRLEGDHLWLLGISTNQGRPSSHLWKYDRKQNQLSVLESFPGLRAEGVAGKTPDGRRVLVFDGGGTSPSKMITIHAEG